MTALDSSPSSASRVAQVLRAGGTAVVPAEGVYGLVCAASRPDAIARLLQLKGRESSKPMLVLASSWGTAEALAAEVPDTLIGLERDRAPVTVLLRARPDVPFGLSGPEGLVGVRLPADRFGTALSEEVGLVVSTSANRSGDPTPRDLGEVPADLLDRVDVVVDGGTLPGTPSTVARWEESRLVVVREGAVDRESLASRTGLHVE